MDAYGPIESNGKYSGTNYTEKLEHHSATAVLQILDEGQKREQFKIQERQRWERNALILAALSVISLIVLGSVSFYVSELTNSAAAYGFGFDCFLDVGTSLVVIWRFCGNNSQSSKKEKIALVLLGFLFIIAATSVAGKAISYLVDGTLMETSVGLYCLAGTATIISGCLFISKFYVANKLDSKSVRADGYSSLACGVTAFTIIISSIAYSYNEDVYYLDDIVGIALAILLLLYGIKIIVAVWCEPSEVETQQTKLTIMRQPGYDTLE